MRWHVSLAGRASGPWEEADVVRMAAAGQLDHVQGENGGPWLPLAQSPFAAYVAAQPSAQPRTATAQSGSSLSGAQWMFIIGAMVLPLVAMLTTWVGIALGIGLVAFTIHRYRNGQRSLIDIAWKRQRGLATAAFTVILGLFTSFCGSTGVLASRAEAVKKERAAEAEQALLKKKADERKALEIQLPTKVTAWRERLAALPATADKEGPEAARLAAATITNEIDTHAQIMGSPKPAPLTSVQDDAGTQAAFYAAWAELGESMKATTRSVDLGKANGQKARWLAADDAYASAIQELDKIQATDTKVAERLPRGFNAAAVRTEVEQLRKAIAGPVNAERKRVEREQALVRAKAEREQAAAKAKEEKEAAYAAICGEKPTISSWDGEVIGLERALKETAHDPDSIDVEKCTNPILTTGSCWLVTCNVRGKNAFGAMILQRRTFSYSKALGFQEAE